MRKVPGIFLSMSGVRSIFWKLTLVIACKDICTLAVKLYRFLKSSYLQVASSSVYTASAKA